MKTVNPLARKPLKVFSADRLTRKSVVSSTFVEFLSICKEKFKVGSGQVSLVLEEDGTEVDEDYWKTLPPNTTLILLKGKNQWIPTGSEFEHYESESCSEEKISSESQKICSALNQSSIDVYQPPFPEKRKSCEDMCDIPEKCQRSEDDCNMPEKSQQSAGDVKDLPTEVPCIVGWLHYSLEKKKYIQKKATAENPNAGIRKVLLPETWKYHDLLVLLKCLFFKDGKNETGEVEMMSCYLGSAKGAVVPAEGFTVGSYLSTPKSAKKLYLLTNPRVPLPVKHQDFPRLSTGKAAKETAPRVVNPTSPSTESAVSSSRSDAPTSPPIKTTVSVSRSASPTSQQIKSTFSAYRSASPTSSLIKKAVSTPPSAPPTSQPASPRVLYSTLAGPSLSPTSTKRPANQQASAQSTIPLLAPIKQEKSEFKRIDLTSFSSLSSGRKSSEPSNSDSIKHVKRPATHSTGSTSRDKPPQRQKSGKLNVPLPAPIKQEKSDFERIDLTSSSSLGSGRKSSEPSSSDSIKHAKQPATLSKISASMDEPPQHQESAKPKKNSETTEMKKCSHCFIRYRDCFFFPCGHWICSRCGQELRSAHLPCPVCEREIVSLRSIFD